MSKSGDAAIIKLRETLASASRTAGALTKRCDQWISQAKIERDAREKALSILLESSPYVFFNLLYLFIHILLHTLTQAIIHTYLTLEPQSPMTSFSFTSRHTGVPLAEDLHLNLLKCTRSSRHQAVM